MTCLPDKDDMRSRGLQLIPFEFLLVDRVRDIWLIFEFITSYYPFLPNIYIYIYLVSWVERDDGFSVMEWWSNKSSSL